MSLTIAQFAGGASGNFVKSLSFSAQRAEFSEQAASVAESAEKLLAAMRAHAPENVLAMTLLPPQEHDRHRYQLDRRTLRGGHAAAPRKLIRLHFAIPLQCNMYAAAQYHGEAS
jgi:hypothetical protein